jgi:adenosylmethionine-8-amino-7-oxononanoate aminotransferase
MDGGQKLEAALRREIEPLPMVGDIRGRGLFWAVEFVLHKNTKKPFPLEANFSNKVVASALRRGVNILGNLGHTGTYQVDHVLVCPPYIVTEGDIDQIVALVKDAIVEISEPFISRF